MTLSKTRLPLIAALSPLLLATFASAVAAAQAHGCLQSRLPRPDRPAAEIRAELEAAGAWHRSGDPDRTPPADPQVGDTWNWYIWDLGGMPVANTKPCTVRGMGDHCYIVVDDDEWNVGIDQEDVDLIVAKFEDQSPGNWPTAGIWDLNTGHFGEPPNPLDDLERVFLLYYRFDISADGYFWVYDQFPDGTQPWASNEADVVYLAVDNGDPAGDYMCAVAAHEFQHMIHYNNDGNENSWLDEGMAELAMWLFGHPDTISSFNSNPDNSLIVWDGAWADYIQTYLWTLYAYERFGGQPFIWDVCHDPANGMASYANALALHGFDQDPEAVFCDWSVANFLDDTTIEDGRFGYVGEELPPFNPFRTHDAYPASGTGSTKNWGTDYIRLDDLPGAPIFTFDGDDVRDFRVALMAVDDRLPAVVRFLALDEANDGSLSFPEAQGYAQVIVSIANVNDYAAGAYTYDVEAGLTAVPGEPAPAPLALASFPNPFNPTTTIAYGVDAASPVRLNVLDAAGRVVRTLVDGHRTPGAYTVDWDGRDDAGRPLASGVYFSVLDAGGRTVSGKMLLLK